ncbi:hypothetical protein L798_04510 [Zootermopsis nevadensis]|uniref:Uncharacterized protein n=1 Tax=Zootermopsis nevadensis TaxID=136037 RepID=A0A067RB73_ZOONE|nr:hypothetical protein L798_04510 [Zootermopsis nevadensis]
MRAKKLATEDGDEILMVLKGAKHITSSVSTDAQFMALTATSPHNWPAVDCSIGVSANSFNSDKSLALDKEHSKSCQEEEQSICGNSSFLRRFIEFRINDSDLSLKMTSGNEKSSVESSGAGKREMKILFTSPGSEDQPSIESSADGANSVASKKPLPDYSDNTSTYPTDMLSRSAIHKERNDSGLQNEEFPPKQSEGNTGRNQVTGDIIRHVFPKIPTIRRVDELRIRIEGNLETTDSTKKVCTIGNSVINNYADEKYSIKSAPEVKEHRSKVEVRRSNSNTRENPPRKVSFKVRSSSNNGRLSSSYISSATSRRSSALSKGSLTDSKIPSKVAVLASKFNAIIHENKEEKSVEIIQNDSRMLPQFPAGSITPSNKKQPQTERAFVSRRNSSNSKREGCLSSTGGNTKSVFLGVALRKHSSTKQPLLEPDNSQKSSNSSITKDCKRRSNMSCRSSAVGTKSGSVKAAIQIFEKNATTTRPAKINAVALGGNRRNVGNSVTCGLKQSLESSEAKKEPKYPRVIFKRDATLVRVTLDCEDVCNEDQTTKQVEDSCNTRTNDCQKSATKLSRGSCEDEEKVCVKNDYVEGFNARCKSDKNVTVVGVGGGSGHDEMKKKEEKIKPVVPVKNVTKKQIYKSVPFFKSDTNDFKYAKVTCKQDSIYRTTSNGSVTENTCVHYDKLAFPHKAPTGSEYSINKIASTLERENFQETDRELMTPNRSFLWGVSPPSNKVRTQDDQSTSVSVPLTDNYEPTNPEVPAPVTNCSIEETYDDVYPPSTVYSDGVSLMHPYSVVHPQDDDMYDDVGSPATEEKQSPRIPAVSAVSNCADDNGTDSGYDYCRGSVEPSLDQNYDDCEGEGYQCIGEDNPHEDAESNIYDDVKSVTTLKVSEDVASISNCYESIYSGGDRSMTSDGRTTIDGGTMRMGGPSSASSSIGSGNHSFCDQSNSLYGVGGCRFDSASVSQASTGMSGFFSPLLCPDLLDLPSQVSKGNVGSFRGRKAAGS